METDPILAIEKEHAQVTSPSNEAISNLDFRIPRRFAEKLVGISTNTLVKYEDDGILTPIKVRRGALDVVTYSVKDISLLLKKRGHPLSNRKECSVILVAAQKGGTGKTNASFQIGSTLSLFSGPCPTSITDSETKKDPSGVCLIDLDSQSDLSSLLDSFSAKTIREYSQNSAKRPAKPEVFDADAIMDPTIMEMMDWTEADDTCETQMRDYNDVIKVASPNLHCIPSDIEVNQINYQLNRLNLKKRVMPDGSVCPAPLLLLKEVIDKLRKHYAYIVIDTAPNVETCNISAMLCADFLLVPIELESKCVRTAHKTVEFMIRVRDDLFKSVFPDFKWRTLISINKYRNETVKKKAYAKLQAHFADHPEVLLSEIVFPSSVIIDKSADVKEPIFSLAMKDMKPSNQVAKQFTDYYYALIHELLDVPLEKLIFGEDELVN